MFKAGYLTQTGEHEPGPRVRPWLESIALGRTDGTIRKDLLSPPSGYALHSGDADADYPMGAVGVDPACRLARFDFRYSPRLQHDVPLNGHARHAARLAQAAAREHNPALSDLGPVPHADAARYAYLSRYEAVYGALKKVRKRLHAPGAGNIGRPFPLPPAVLAARVKVARLQREIALLSRPPWLADTNAALDAVEDLLDPMTGWNDARVEAAGLEFDQRVEQFEQALWLAGG